MPNRDDILREYTRTARPSDGFDGVYWIDTDAMADEIARLREFVRLVRVAYDFATDLWADGMDREDALVQMHDMVDAELARIDGREPNPFCDGTPYA